MERSFINSIALRKDKSYRNKWLKPMLLFLLCNLLTCIVSVLYVKFFHKEDDEVFSSGIGEVFFIFLFVAIPSLLITGAMYLGCLLALGYNFRQISNVYANIGIVALVAIIWYLILQLGFGQVVFISGHILLSESLHTVNPFYLIFSLIAFVQINIVCILEMPDE